MSALGPRAKVRPRRVRIRSVPRKRESQQAWALVREARKRKCHLHQAHDAELCFWVFLVYMPPPIPRCSNWPYSSLNSPSCFSLPRYGSRIGLHIFLFEACSTFTRVAACTLALSPIRDTANQRLQPVRYRHDCCDCFRLERLPGGACTHWKAPPLHGARQTQKSPLLFDARSWQPFRALAPLQDNLDFDP